MNLLSTDKLNISINETLHIKNNNVIYTNTKTNNSLVVLSNKNEYDIYCHMKYRKLIIYCNYSDPPDYLYFIPIDEIIVNPLLDYSDHRLDYQGQYYIDAETTWSNEIDLADDYVLITTESYISVYNISANENEYLSSEHEDKKMKITSIVNNTIHYGYVDIPEEDEENENSSLNSDDEIVTDITTCELYTLFEQSQP